MKDQTLEQLTKLNLNNKSNEEIASLKQGIELNQTYTDLDSKKESTSWKAALAAVAPLFALYVLNTCEIPQEDYTDAVQNLMVVGSLVSWIYAGYSTIKYPSRAKKSKQVWNKIKEIKEYNSK